MIPKLGICDEGIIDKTEHETSQFLLRRFVDEDYYMDKAMKKRFCFYFNELGLLKKKIMVIFACIRKRQSHRIENLDFAVLFIIPYIAFLQI